VKNVARSDGEGKDARRGSLNKAHACSILSSVLYLDLVPRVEIAQGPPLSVAAQETVFAHPLFALNLPRLLAHPLARNHQVGVNQPEEGLDHYGAVSSAHWPGCGDALHPAGAAGATVWAAHGSRERAASVLIEKGALGVAQCFWVVAVPEGIWVQWHVRSRHHLPPEAGLEPLLLFRCLLKERVHRDRVVSSGAHWPGCVDALHPARAAGAAVWAAHGSSERAASHEIGAARVAPCLQDVAVHEGNWVQWHVCGGHHLPLEAGLEPLLLF